MASINFWSVLTAAITAFVIGAIWYSPILFGKEWVALMKMSEKDIAAAKTRGVVKLYIFQFIAMLVSFIVLAFLVSNTASSSAGDGAFLGFLVWLGFVAPLGVSALCWEKQPMKLVLIDFLCVLLTTVVGGAILGAWR